MELTAARMAIETLEIAEFNLLQSIKHIQPSEVYSRPSHELNSIGWIFGHCAMHYHWAISLSYLNENFFTEQDSHYYRYGTTKEELDASSPPHRFGDFLDTYLRMTRRNLEFLKNLDETEFYKPSKGNEKESLLFALFRIALHYVGHMGQIVLLRKLHGNPGPTFIGGLSGRERDVLLDQWRFWWSKSKSLFLR